MTPDAIGHRRVVRIRRAGPGDRVLVVQIDSPPVNALAEPVRAGLIEAAAQAADAGVRAVVLQGNGRCFSAGGDIAELSAVAAGAPGRPADAVHAQYLALYRSWQDIAVPVVAAVRRYCLGGALELALACDLRCADPAAFLAASGVSMGLVESAHSLPRAIGLPRAMDMLMTARRVPAPEAFAMGLLTSVAEEPEAAALDLAQRIAEHPREALVATKRVARAAVEPASDAAGLAVGLWAELERGAAHRDRVSAFLARRDAG